MKKVFLILIILMVIFLIPNKEGFNILNYNIKTLSKYNKDGYNKDGYDKDGYDILGYNKQGYDKDGYDKDGWNKESYNKDGYYKTATGFHACYDEFYEKYNYIFRTVTCDYSDVSDSSVLIKIKYFNGKTDIERLSIDDKYSSKYNIQTKKDFNGEYYRISFIAGSIMLFDAKGTIF